MESGSVNIRRLLFRATGPCAPNLNLFIIQMLNKFAFGATLSDSYTIVRPHFNSGPDHMGVFLSPSVGIHLVSWSLADRKILQGPDWKQGRATHYIFHSQVSSRCSSKILQGPDWKQGRATHYIIHSQVSSRCSTVPVCDLLRL